jgi:ligand-binding SRPBCC domain-containing protein
MIHHLVRQQAVSAPIERVWNYFATPANLNELTPNDMHCICQSKSRPLYKRKTNHFGKIKIKNTIKKSTILQLKNRPLRMSLDVIEFQHPNGG